MKLAYGPILFGILRTMPIVAKQSALAEQTAEPRFHRFSRAEYYQMADWGFFNSKRVELIDGEVFDMPQLKDAHAAAILLAQQALQKALPNLLVRPQMPLVLGLDSDPEPDISVVTGSIRDYIGTGHPRTALLILEVSDTTLRFDRERKASLYACASIQDYWIVNLINKCVEVMRQPTTDPSPPLGYRYKSITTLQPPQLSPPSPNPKHTSSSPTCFPDASP